ncbi:hypothetical protein [Lutibacter sp.]|uniref:hypothetical protein n=1 Tax=Lutibacter sp. TaxID=1925666 RepID=UPI0027336517|nr:hypothetical protein [Lutibacter sp.]MDP3312701.1 hypothetical protein [Lutibacter sp.]
MKRKEVSYFLWVILLLSSTAIYSQDPPPPVGLPIDGGIVLLVIFGVFYGVFCVLKR